MFNESKLIRWYRGDGALNRVDACTHAAAADAELIHSSGAIRPTSSSYQPNIILMKATTISRWRRFNEHRQMRVTSRQPTSEFWRLVWLRLDELQTRRSTGDKAAAAAELLILLQSLSAVRCRFSINFTLQVFNLPSYNDISTLER